MLRVPYYYPSFQCTGSACRDNCCIGWEIEIDQQSFARYRNLPGTMGERLRQSISEAGGPHFLLHGEQCPFLNQEHLCDLILFAGEEQLCQICRDHPRFFEWFGSFQEAGLGLCCEEAGRLLFAQREPIAFLELEQSLPGEQKEAPPPLLDILFQARNTAFHLAQERTLSIEERCALLLDFADQLQSALDLNSPDLIPKLCKQAEDPIQRAALLEQLKQEACWEQESVFQGMLSFYQGLEPDRQSWMKKLRQLSVALPELLKLQSEFLAACQERNHEYEHLLVYFLFRYFLKAVFDLEVLPKVKLAVCSFLLIYLCDLSTFSGTGTLTSDQRVGNAKDYSREIEYSPENLDAFYLKSWEEDCFSLDALFSLLFTHKTKG